MSSILKALKKLENQATNQNHVRFWLPQNHMQKDDREETTGRVRLKKRHIIILTGLVFAVSAGLILSRKLPEKKSELIAKKEAILEKTVRLPEKRTAMPDKVQIELSSRKEAKTFEPIVKAAKAPPSAHKSRRNGAGLFNRKTIPLKQVQKETVAAKRSEKPKKNIKTDRFATIPVKRSNQTNIEVQAIAWSNDPKSRLAVINGLILRERESIDNVTVMHIGKDEVIFKNGREEWKQMFGF